jgi:imidazole glycerol-phosphate synthase subunit HisF
MQGYDLDLARKVRAAITTPMTVVGGAGSTDDLRALTEEMGPIGAGAGSLFVFRGKYRAVLISYARP